MKRHFLFSIALFLSITTISNTIDSLQYQLKNSTDTIQKIDILCKLARITSNDKNNLSINFANQAHNLAEKYNDSCLLCKTFYARGIAEQGKTNYSNALNNYILSYERAKLCNNTTILHRTSNNLGMLNKILGDTIKAFEWFEKSFTIANENKDTTGLIWYYMNTGNMYNHQLKFNKAINKYNKALFLIKESKNHNKYYSILLYNLAYAHYDNGNIQEAINKFHQALKLAEGNDLETAMLLKSIAEIQYEQNNFNQAIIYLDSAGYYYNKIDRKDKQGPYYLMRYKVELKLNMHKEALEDLQTYQALQDSIDLQEMHILLTDIQSKYENDNLKSQNENQKERIKSKNRLMFIFGLIMILSIIILFFLLFINHQRKQNNITLKLKQSKIDEGIEYAKYVKNKLMNSNLDLLKTYPYFIIDKPCDGVGGDFYMVKKHSKGIYIIVGDATGHGIPGGFISISILNIFHHILEKETTPNPQKILTQVLHKWIEQSNSHKTFEETFTASILFISDKNAILSSFKQKSILLEEKTCTCPEKNTNISKNKLGVSDNIEINLSPKSWIILSSDGYYDQLGTNKKRRLGFKSFKNTIEEIHNNSSNNIKKDLLEKHKHHKDTEQQTDDILVLGIGLISVKH